MKRQLFSSLLLLISTLSFAQDNVHFSEQYKQENQGKYKIEINEVKELVTIMLAITDYGKGNDDMFEQRGQYYQDLRAYFEPYENEKIIQTFDSLMVASPYNYIFLTGNAMTYDFDGDKLVKSDVFIFPAQGVANVGIDKNPMITYKKEIETFAKTSKFREFYANHQEFYSNIIADYEKNANLGKQWNWLETNFETQKNSYIIFCSPLINGLNYTGQFTNNDFSLIYMMLPPLDNYPNLSPFEKEILNTRIMFTEIDHNYVHTPTEANAELINHAFADRKFWVNEDVYGTFAYPNPVKVFNEYMTFGVFLLYCQDQYGQKGTDTAVESVVSMMKERGFPEMKFFTDKLFEMRAKYPNKKIDEWYPEFLNQFSSNQI